MVDSPPAPAATPAGAPPVDEFAHVPSPRSRQPLLAAVVVLTVLGLLYHERSDLAYALADAVSTDLGTAARAFAPGAPRPAANRLVRVEGTPDRESAVEIDTKGKWTFSQLYRIRGTGGRLYVHRTEDPLPSDKAQEDVFVGRLIRFGDLSFAESIRSWFSGHVAATHFFRREDFVRALGAPPTAGRRTLRDLGGDEVPVAEGDVVALDVVTPGELRVAFPRDKWPDMAGARAELTKRGATVMAEGGAPAGPHELAFTLPEPQREQVLEELGNLSDKVALRPARDTFKIRMADLSVAGADLAIRGGRPEGTPARLGGEVPPARLSQADVVSIRTLAAVEIPADAFILIESDRPRDHFHSLAVGGFLVLFALLNVLGARRAVR